MNAGFGGAGFGFAQPAADRSLSEAEGITAEHNTKSVTIKADIQENRMPYMYILQCADGSYYTGSTWNLEKRFGEHQQGMGARHTAKRLPVKLVYCEEYARIDEAFFREKQVQGWSRKKKEALMAGNTDELHRLAACRNESSHAGFGNAGFGSAQPAENRSLMGHRSLSGAEGCDVYE